jgi:hypothetical protein
VGGVEAGDREEGDRDHGHEQRDHAAEAEIQLAPDGEAAGDAGDLPAAAGAGCLGATTLR